MTFAKALLIATTAAGLSIGLAACVESRTHLSDDFGAAARQDAVAQIADPEGRYRRGAPPAANGVRAALAQDRYQTGKTIQPAATASKISGGMTGAAAGAASSGQ